MSLVLFVGTRLLTRSLLNLEARPLGFEQEHALPVRINLRLGGYKPAALRAE